MTPAPVRAHDPGLSAADVRLGPEGIYAHLVFAVPDVSLLVELDTDRDGRITPAELETARPRLVALARQAIDLRAGGRSLSPAADVVVLLDTSNGLHLGLRFPSTRGAVTLRPRLLSRLPRGHRQYLSVRDAEGRLVQERILQSGSAEVVLDPASTPRSGPFDTFRRFVSLGVEHIVRGYDHLLFLFGLLLVGTGFRGAVEIITSFTVAHSLALALATFDVVRVPGSVVEPLIAASIVYVGVENLVRRGTDHRWVLTFAFGLIHGLGFASVLRELGIGGSAKEVAVPLLAFNVGVELGQLAIAAVVLPLLWRLGREPSFARRWAPALSAFVALAGGAWLVQRTLFA
ncbi:MAG: HupE/UreJ family protein [Gemmatimonadota bacterium]